MGLNHYIGEIKRGLKAPAYLLYGESNFLLKEAYLLTLSIIPEDRRDFSLDIIDLDDVERPSIEHIIDILNTMPFLGNKRFVIIENAHLMKKREISLITEYISNPSPFSILIMLYLGKLKNDINDLLQKVKSIQIDIRPQDMPSWIKEKAMDRGVNLTNGAIDYLMAITSQDIGLISSEIEKIALLGKREVDVTDISGIIKNQGDYDVFDLIEAIKKKDKKRAFRVLRRILDSQEPFGIIGAINWHFGRLKDGSKDIARVFNLLLEADLNLKASGGRYPLEYLLIRLLE